jgi:hypothetical protein
MNSENTFDNRIEKLIGTVKNTEADLKDPASLTDDIMSGLTDRGRKPGSRHVGIFQHVAFRRFISAAAIILFSVFAFEQFIILDKINRLEESRQNPPEKAGWEMRTVMKYQDIKANHKTIFDIVESLGKDNGKKPGILKRYFKQKTQINLKKQNKMGIH